MLNNLARPTRIFIASFGFAIGLMIGGPSLGDSGVGSALLGAGLAVELVVILGFPLVTRREERALRRTVAEATGEIASGAVEAVPAIGRVVRRRIVKLDWFLPGRGTGSGPTVMAVLTAVGDGEPRRVAALVPAEMGLAMRRVPAALLLHPHQRDVAVVDDRITPADLAAIDADPRWSTERLPSDRTVVGGYAALLAALVVGIAAGFGVSALVVTLAT